MKAEYGGQMQEYKKLLDMRATRIQKLEVQLREAAYGRLQKNVANNPDSFGVMIEKETSVHTASGQSLFEIHLHKATLTKVSSSNFALKPVISFLYVCLGLLDRLRNA